MPCTTTHGWRNCELSVFQIFENSDSDVFMSESSAKTNPEHAFCHICVLYIDKDFQQSDVPLTQTSFAWSNMDAKCAPSWIWRIDVSLTSFEHTSPSSRARTLRQNTQDQIKKLAMPNQWKFIWRNFNKWCPPTWRSCVQTLNVLNQHCMEIVCNGQNTNNPITNYSGHANNMFASRILFKLCPRALGLQKTKIPWKPQALTQGWDATQGAMRAREGYSKRFWLESVWIMFGPRTLCAANWPQRSERLACKQAQGH